MYCISYPAVGYYNCYTSYRPQKRSCGWGNRDFFQNIGILFCTFHQKLWITLSGKILYFMIFDPPGSIHYLKYYIQNLTWGLDTSKVSCADAIKYCFPMVEIFIWYLTMEKPYMEAICFIFFFKCYFMFIKLLVKVLLQYRSVKQEKADIKIKKPPWFQTM